jgi:hypothetical protein
VLLPKLVLLRRAYATPHKAQPIAAFYKLKLRKHLRALAEIAAMRGNS